MSNGYSEDYHKPRHTRLDKGQLMYFIKDLVQLCLVKYFFALQIMRKPVTIFEFILDMCLDHFKLSSNSRLHPNIVCFYFINLNIDCVIFYQLENVHTIIYQIHLKIHLCMDVM